MMKKLAVLMGAASVAVLALQPQPAYAGDREWATAGKILTGVVVGQVLLNGILCPQRTVVVERPVVVGGCAPVAVYAPPVPGVYAPVVYSPPPVVYAPVVYSPPPVVYAPVVYSPPPVVYVPPVCTTRIVYSSGCYAPPPWYCYPSRGSSFSIHYHSGWHSSRHPHRHVRCR